MIWEERGCFPAVTSPENIQRGFEQAKVLLVVRKLSWLCAALGVVGLGLLHLLQALCFCVCHISHLRQVCRSDQGWDREWSWKIFGLPPTTLSLMVVHGTLAPALAGLG